MRGHALVSASRSVLGKWLLVPALVLLALMPTTARAAAPVILRVKVGGGAAGTCGGLADWSNACDLQYALKTRADTSGGATYELWVAAGTYKPTTVDPTVDPTARSATFQLKSGVALYGGFAGTESSRDARDIAANETILSGDLKGDDSGDVSFTNATRSDNSYHVVTGSGTDYTAALDGFSVREGNADWPVAPYASGGGMYNDHGSPTVTNVTFSNNSTDWSGGGMSNGSSSPGLWNVTFSGNSAPVGGGMYNLGSYPTLTNVTFSGNSANDGGGMYNDNGQPTLWNVTFSGNSANVRGGGMYNYNNNYNSSPIILNTILWGNTATWKGPEIYNEATSPPDIESSVVQGGCPDASSTCTHIIPTDPHLGPLGDYGGATQTIPLLPGSSAIDAGNDAICAGAPVNNLDQRGVTRPQGAHCDIGAYESRGFTLTKTGGDHQSTPVNTAFALPLQVTLTETGGSGLEGGVITYAAPSSGASASWGASTTTTRTTMSGGIAAAPGPTANGTPGSYAVTADAPGVSSPVAFLLTNQANTTTALTASPNPSLSGQAVTLTATVTVLPPGSGTPLGTVQFKADGVNLGSAAVLSGGKASLITGALAVGTHSITAVYSGDTNFAGSTSNTLTQTVRPVLFLPLLVR